MRSTEICPRKVMDDECYPSSGTACLADPPKIPHGHAGGCGINCRAAGQGRLETIFTGYSRFESLCDTVVSSLQPTGVKVGLLRCRLLRTEMVYLDGTACLSCFRSCSLSACRHLSRYP